MDIRSADLNLLVMFDAMARLHKETLQVRLQAVAEPHTAVEALESGEADVARSDGREHLLDRFLEDKC